MLIVLFLINSKKKSRIKYIYIFYLIDINTIIRINLNITFTNDQNFRLAFKINFSFD